MQEIIEKLEAQTDCKLNLFTYDFGGVLRQELSESILLVNTTSVGMAPNIEDSLITDTTMFHPKLTVSDIIYNPEETRSFFDWLKGGCKTFNGLHMLLYQGAAAFKLWTGQEMPIQVIKEKYFQKNIFYHKNGAIGK